MASEFVKGVGVADQTMQMSVVVSRESRPAKTELRNPETSTVEICCIKVVLEVVLAKQAWLRCLSSFGIGLL